MRRNFDDVLDLHRAHDLPVGERSALLKPPYFTFRYRFLQEELKELEEAHLDGDLAGVADALVDLVVVALGTAVWMGLPWQDLWDEVHRANMSKVRGRKTEREYSQDTIDLVKPPGWRPPDISGVLEGRVDRSRFPKIVCLCGSTRFKEEFIEQNFLETMRGNIVLTVGWFGHADVYTLTPEEKAALDELHKRKIDLADEVVVLNVNGYVGESTRSEIEYARRRGKLLRFREDER